MNNLNFTKKLLAISLILTICISSSFSATTQPASAPATEPATQPASEAASQSTSQSVDQADAKKILKIAHIRLAGIILEGPPGFSFFANTPGQLTLKDVLLRLSKARKDKNVGIVALEIDSLNINWAQAQELAEAVTRLNAEKPVHTYLSSASAGQYLVASAGEEIAMEPAGTLMLVGLGAELTFFRGTLDLLGIEPQMVQVGRYKGASEPYARKGPSQEMLYEYEKILDDLYYQLCNQIAKQRGLKIAKVQKAIDSGPLSAAAGKKAKLVDKLITKLDWQKEISDSTDDSHGEMKWHANYGKKSPRHLNTSSPFSFFSAVMGGDKKTKVRNSTIAIIHADGLIVPGPSGEGIFGQKMVGAKTLTECFERVRKDDRIKAVIFRVNSPGGSALASELIYQAAKKCAQQKPVIASIAQMGASGGYYIAIGADTIVADDSAIVGSVGVISGKLSFTGLMKKAGISTHEITRGRNAGLFLSRPWSQREMDVIRKHAETTYDMFVERVSESRADHVKDINSVTQGRIFTGRQASENGLIDEVGGLHKAVNLAKEKAKLDKVHFLTLPEPKTFFDIISGNVEANSTSALTDNLTIIERMAGKSPGMVYLINLANLLNDEAVSAAMPHFFSIKH